MTGILCVLAGAGSADLNPNPFSFNDATGLELSSLTTSNTITPTGYDATTTWSVTNGGTASINGGAYASSGTISPGQNITVRGTSSSSNSTTVSFVVSIGTTQSTWSITTKAAPTDALYSTPGTYSFVVPSGVTSVSMIVIGGGAGGGSNGIGGGGGALVCGNNIAVTPGESLTVVVGAGGVGSFNQSQGENGYQSRVARGGSNFFSAGGGSVNGTRSGISGGSVTPSNFGAGAAGAGGVGGGGAAAGYSGSSQFDTFGNGKSYPDPGNAGANGSGGGGGAGGFAAAGSFNGKAGCGGGGGTGVYGQGSSGGGGSVGGDYGTFASGGSGGGGGSPAGISGQTGSGGGPTYDGYAPYGGSGGFPGGGGGSGGYSSGPELYFTGTGGNGASGAVRIIWPGNTRLFPSTNVG